MKLLKVNRKFKDKYNGTIYAEGELIEFEDDRAAELLADPRGLAEEAGTTGTLDPEQLKELKLDDLRRLADDLGVNHKGLKKAELVNAIAAVEVTAGI